MRLMSEVDANTIRTRNALRLTSRKPFVVDARSTQNLAVRVPDPVHSTA